MAGSPTRTERFWAILRSSRKRVPYNVFADDLQDNEGEKKSDSTIRQTLQKMKKHPLPGTILRVGRNSAELIREPETVIQERAKHRADVKRRLARVVWDVLFGIGVRKSEEYDLTGTSAAFWRKVCAARRKSVVRTYLDAGSTTLAVARGLDDVPSMPLEVRMPSSKIMESISSSRTVSGGKTPQTTGIDEQTSIPEAPRDDPERGDDFIRLHIVTNSVPIAYAITESRHRNDVGITVVGGDVRVDRASICGTASSICLDAWDVRGDIAIVGATGYRTDRLGTPSFCCDTLSEANLKSSFLKSCWTRVCCIDATKLHTFEISKTFVPLHQLDLIVSDFGLDDGGTNELAATVQEFKMKANEQGVATAILRQKRRRSAARESESNSGTAE